MQLISRKDAKAQGLTRYYTGKPCLRGHVSERKVAGFACLICSRAAWLAYAKQKPSRVRVHQKRAARKRYYADVEKSRARVRADNWKRAGIRPTTPRPKVCECCAAPPNGKGTLHADHDHTTGAFRGWLCFKCNSGIGNLGDNAPGVRRALAYLRRRH